MLIYLFYIGKVKIRSKYKKIQHKNNNPKLKVLETTTMMDTL